MYCYFKQHIRTRSSWTQKKKHTLKLGLCIITNTSSRKKKEERRATIDVAENIKPATEHTRNFESCSWLNSSFRLWTSTKTGTHDMSLLLTFKSFIQFSHIHYTQPLFSHHLSSILYLGYSLSSCAWHESLLSNFSSASPHPWRWGRCLWMPAAVAG